MIQLGPKQVIWLLLIIGTSYLARFIYSMMLLSIPKFFCCSFQKCEMNHGSELQHDGSKLPLKPKDSGRLLVPPILFIGTLSLTKTHMKEMPVPEVIGV